jgi:hypothetical protein
MLLSYRYRFLFIHIAKTGGTSIRTALRPYRWGWPYTGALMLCSLMSQMTRPRHILGIKFPRHAKAIAAQEMLPDTFYDSLFKFTVVRNPWDLQVSSYHHLRREHPEVVKDLPDFRSFLLHKFDPRRERDFLLDISRERQWHYITDHNGASIIDFVARYESLANHYAEICQRIGIPGPTLPHQRQATDRGDYRDYYDQELQEMVAEHYAEDIRRFGYSFDAPSQNL